MADSGPFKIVGWMSDDFSSWLYPAVGGHERWRLLHPQQQPRRGEIGSHDSC